MVSFIDTVEFSAHSAAWLELLVAAALKGALVLVIALVLNFALRRSSAASRHLVWSLALASLLAIPLLSFGLPSWQVPVLPDSFAVARHEAAMNSDEFIAPASMASGSLPQDSQPSITVKEQARTNARGFPEPPAPVSRQSTSGPLDWSSLALMVWMAGALSILVRLLIGTAIVWWMARRAGRITDGEWVSLVERLAAQVGINRPVTLLKSSRITMPVTCGLVRSAVLLPSDTDDWSEERRHVVLLHELAHVKRRDCLTQMLAQVACAIYWFNPLIWGAARQLRMERERACDDHVLDAGTKASDYADHLLDLARSFRSARCSSLAAVAIARRSQLEGRLLAILDPSLSRRGLNRIASISIGLIVALVVLPLAVIRPAAHAQSKASIHREATRSITFDATGQTIAPETKPASAVVAQAAGEITDHQLKQSAQAAQADMAQAARLAEDEQGTEQEAEQATKPEQRDVSSTIEALAEALKDEDAEVRQHAMFALTQIGGPRATEILAAALKDPDPEVRAKAVWGLGIRPGDGMVDALINALRDGHPEVRGKAAWSLGLKGDRRSVQPLVNALKDENDEVRQMAAWALGLRGNGQAVEPLMDALKDKDVEVRGMAAWALGLRSDKRAAKALSAALKDEDKEVRQKAAWALGMLLMSSGEAGRGDNDVDVDVDMDVDSDGNRSGAGAKAKTRTKQR
jgi:beta-lactamase regulating signal transducer with metallopeptidase domain/HEAT repeat protein